MSAKLYNTGKVVVGGGGAVAGAVVGNLAINGFADLTGSVVTTSERYSATVLPGFIGVMLAVGALNLVISKLEERSLRRKAREGLRR